MVHWIYIYQSMFPLSKHLYTYQSFSIIAHLFTAALRPHPRPPAHTVPLETLLFTRLFVIIGQLGSAADVIGGKSEPCGGPGRRSWPPNTRQHHRNSWTQARPSDPCTPLTSGNRSQLADQAESWRWKLKGSNLLQLSPIFFFDCAIVWIQFVHVKTAKTVI